MAERRYDRAFVWALALLLALLALPPPAMAQDAGPDFSSVTSKSEARRLVREGRLVRITLFPAELGGPDDEPMNVSYVTPQAAAARDAAIGRLEHLIDEGEVDQLRVSPDYKGDSLVPSRITLSARHSEKEGSIDLVIEVW